MLRASRVLIIVLAPYPALTVCLGLPKDRSSSRLLNTEVCLFQRTALSFTNLQINDTTGAMVQ
jgi:hypothetical protein